MVAGVRPRKKVTKVSAGSDLYQPSRPRNAVMCAT